MNCTRSKLIINFSSMSIKLPSGDLVKADREVAYAFGHWMGLADMAYCMDGGKLN